MNISQVQTIIAISKTGSISKAAEVLHRSQPNVSNELKSIEKQYDVKLFNRTYDGAILTPIGEKFLESCININTELKNLDSIQSSQINIPSNLHIGTIKETYSICCIQNWISEKILNHNSLIYIHEDTTSQIIDNIIANVYHFGIIHTSSSTKNQIINKLITNNIKYIPVVKYNLKLIVNNRSPILFQTLESTEDLTKYIEIIQGSTSITHYKTNNPNKIILYDRDSMIRFLSNIDNAYAWSPPLPIDCMINNNLKSKDYFFETDFIIDYIIYKDLNITKDVISSFEYYTKSYVDSLKFM